MQIEGHQATDTLGLVPSLLSLYSDVYGVAPYVGDPFFSVETYAQRLTGALEMSGFEIFTASVGQTIVGSVHGVTLPPDVKWWESLKDSIPDEFIEAANRGTIFWLRELMVREPYRNNGLGRALHDRLRESRAEEFVTMTVIIDNEPARSAYLRWGYEIIGRIRHSPESPLYDAMIQINKQ